MKDITHINPEFQRYMVDDPIWNIHEHGIDVKANHLYLLGEESYQYGVGDEDTGEPGVEFIMANRFIKNLNILMRRSDKPILIHMKTCGGHWSEGMAIYDAIKACPNRICILNYTHARSMSSLIFQAADKRVMMPHSEFMFHHGSMWYGGTSKQFLTEAEQLKKSCITMTEIYTEKMKEKGCFSKRSKSFIRDWIEEEMKKKEEVFMDAKETVKHGFADEIFGEKGVYDWTSLLTFE
jgi:ATP-dependent protease ClpP protease subunit